MDDSHPDSTTIPSSDAIPITPESPKHNTNPPPHPTLLQKLRYIIARRAQNAALSTDRTLLRLSALLSTPSGIDVALCTTGYTLTLVHALGQQTLAQHPQQAHAKLLTQTITSAKATADVIADYRIFVRMWGLLGLYTWARSTYTAPLPATASTKDRLLRATTWAALASCVAFQVLENGAYAASKGMLTSAGWAGEAGKKRETWWWVWSSRFWAAYVGCEVVRLGIEKAWWARGVGEVAGDGEKEDKLRVEHEKREEYERGFTWWKDLVSNVAYAPMTLHWSVEEGLLSELQVGIFGTVAGGALLVDAWRKTL